MPDANGMPTTQDVFDKLTLTAPDALTPPMQADVAMVLASVIAEFQSPPSPRPGGGTGRTFVAVTETRLYDGSGGPELTVDDIVPTLPYSVAFQPNIYAIPTAGVTLRHPQEPGAGWNVLVRSTADYWLGIGAGYIPRGTQNVAVTATFGVVPVPSDVWEAIRCEAAYRCLVQGFVPLSGVGLIMKTADGSEVDTSAGVSVWKESSPIAVFHAVYEAAVARHRRSPQRAWNRLAVRRQMS